MSLIAKCPKSPNHGNFITTAHVVEEWVVDSKGGFCSLAEKALEVTHGPDRDNVWSCLDCGTQAVFEEEQSEESKAPVTALITVTDGIATFEDGTTLEATVGQIALLRKLKEVLEEITTQLDQMRNYYRDDIANEPDSSVNRTIEEAYDLIHIKWREAGK